MNKSNFIEKNFYIKEIDLSGDDIFKLTNKKVVVFSPDEIIDLIKMNGLFSREIFEYLHTNYKNIKEVLIKDSKKNKDELNYNLVRMIMFITDLAMCGTYLDFHTFIIEDNKDRTELFKDFLNLIYLNSEDLHKKYKEIVNFLEDEKSFLDEENYYKIIKNEFLGYLEKL